MVVNLEQQHRDIHFMQHSHFRPPVLGRENNNLRNCYVFKATLNHNSVDDLPEKAVPVSATTGQSPQCPLTLQIIMFVTRMDLIF